MPYLNHSDSASETADMDAFHRLVEDLSDVLGPSSGIDSDDIDPADLQRLMATYQSDHRQWQPYAFRDPSRCYTRNLVDEGNGKSNLVSLWSKNLAPVTNTVELIIVWNPAKGSPIHDHANAHCVMKILKGSLKETLYSLPAPQCCPNHPHAPAVAKETIYAENEVTYISDKIGLHKISNPSNTDVAVSLHLYTPPHAANFGFNLFDERTGKATHIKQAGFFSERGEKLEQVGCGNF